MKKRKFIRRKPSRYINQETCVRVGQHLLKVAAKEEGLQKVLRQAKVALDHQIKRACEEDPLRISRADAACALKSKTRAAIEMCAPDISRWVH